MTPSPTIALLSALIMAHTHAHESNSDILNLIQGDQLHGSFTAFSHDQQTIWNRNDLKSPISIQSNQIQKIILQEPLNNLPTSNSFVTLTNGDTLPGTITDLTPNTITLTGPELGTLNIPRSLIESICPNPTGGQTLYRGPYTPDQWSMIHPIFPNGLPSQAEMEEKLPLGESAPDRWEFHSCSWTWLGGDPGTALIKNTCIPDCASIQFTLDWQGELNAVMAFHADFCKISKTTLPESPPANTLPEAFNKERFTANSTAFLPSLLGNANIVHFQSDRIALMRSHFLPPTKPKLERFLINSEKSHRENEHSFHVEIRSQRSTGLALLFINGEFVTEWEPLHHSLKFPTPENPLTGIAFIAPTHNSHLKISNITISDWNGMPDSAKSFDLPDKDSILLTNGTDRYSGTALSISNQKKLSFKTSLATLEIPLAEIASLHLAHPNRQPTPQSPRPEWILHFRPYGEISANSPVGDRSKMQFSHPLLGPLNASLHSAVLINRPPNPSSF